MTKATKPSAIEMQNITECVNSLSDARLATTWTLVSGFAPGKWCTRVDLVEMLIDLAREKSVNYHEVASAINASQE